MGGLPGVGPISSSTAMLCRSGWTRSGPSAPAGRQEVENVVRLLAGGGARVANVVHSGKLRAQQTAELLATALAAGRVPEVIAGLSPNDPVEPWCDKGPRLLAAPRTDPGERHYRTELPPRVIASNRQSGWGCRSFGLGSQRSAIRIILWQVSRCRWLRRRLPARDRRRGPQPSSS